MIAWCGGEPAEAQTFDYTTTSLQAGNASWSSLVWNPTGTPNGAGITVGLDNGTFTRTLTMDQNVTLGGMRFYNADATTLTGGQITWDTGQAGVIAELGRNRGSLTSITAGRDFNVSTAAVLNSDLRVTNWQENRVTRYTADTSGVGKLTLRAIPAAASNTCQLDFGGTAANTHQGGTTIVGANTDGGSSGGTASVRLQVTINKNDAFGSGVLTIEGSTPVDLNLSARSATVAGLVSSVGSADHVIRNSSATTASTLTLKLVDGVSSTYARALGSRTIGGTLYSGNNLALVIDKTDGSTGTGIQTLSGFNTYTGTTTLAGGTLSLGGAAAMNGGGTVTFTGGTLRHADANGATIDLGARIRSSSSAIKVDTNGNDVSYSAIDATNVGGLEKVGNGTLALTGSNLYTGNSTVAAGTLRIGSGSTSGSILGDVVLSAEGATLAFNRSDAFAFVGAITGSGQVRQSGPGQLTLGNASSSYSGGTSINAGTLAVTAANALGTGNVTVANGARLRLDVSPVLGGGSEISLLSGAEFVTTGSVLAPLATGSSLSGWSSTSAGGTAASLLQATALTATTFSTGWVTNPGDYLSDILTLSGTTASVSNVMVLSMAYDPAYSGALTDLNIFTRPNSAGAFVAVGSSFEGVGVPWTASFQTPGQYGVSDGRVWAVTATNSQFVVDTVLVVPEPGAVALAACGVGVAGFGFRRRGPAR